MTLQKTVKIFLFVCMDNYLLDLPCFLNITHIYRYIRVNMIDEKVQ